MHGWECLKGLVGSRGWDSGSQDGFGGVGRSLKGSECLVGLWICRKGSEGLERLWWFFGS